MIVDGSLERIGNFGIDLSGYATTTAISALETRVGTLESNYVTSATFAAVASGLDTRIGTLESNYNAASTAISALDTKISNIELAQNTYVTSAVFASVVGNISAFAAYTTATNVADSIADIYDRLTWVELSE